MKDFGLGALPCQISQNSKQIYVCDKGNCHCCFIEGGILKNEIEDTKRLYIMYMEKI